MENFRVLWISEKTLEMLEKKGFENPSPIQAGVIPLLLEWDRNIIWQAATGTWKTAAFGIPMIEKLKKTWNVQALVLAPTRELAIQVAEEINSFQSGKDALSVVPIYGWQSYDIQNRALKRWADIIVGTPGRVIDHINRKTLKLDNVVKFILDEADEMLNMGFVDDIEKIFSKISSDSQVLLFSATMPKTILKVAKKYMGDYEHVAIEKTQMTTTQTDQIYFEVNERDKFEALCRIVDIEDDFYWIVFCKTKYDVDTVCAKLIERNHKAQALHWDVQQKQRERILGLFKNRKVNILVATDVAARGIDVNDITHVINYSLPEDPERYIHRVGRTGRAGKTWTAITFVSPQEYRRIGFFQRATKTDIKKWTIPEIEQIIESRKTKLQKDIDAILDGDWYKKLLKVSESLLEGKDAAEVLAALLKIHYQEVFDAEHYHNISEVNIDRAGKARLFMAIGKKDGYSSPRALVEYIEKETWVKGRLIDDVRVMEDFSFVTVPFLEAEVILKAFDKLRKSGQRSIVSRAKDDRSGWWRSWWWNRRGGSRDRKSFGSDRRSWWGSRDRKSFGSDRRSWGWSRDRKPKRDY